MLAVGGGRGQPLEQLRLARLAADGWPGWHHRTMGHKSHESPTHKDAGSSDLGSGLVWDDAFDSRTSFITAARLFTTVSAGDFPFCSILFYFISLFLQILAAFIGFCVLAADAGIAVFYFLFSIFHFPLFLFFSGLASLFLLVLHYGFLWFIFGFKWFPPALNTLWLFSPGFGLSHFFWRFSCCISSKTPSANICHLRVWSPGFSSWFPFALLPGFWFAVLNRWQASADIVFLNADLERVCFHSVLAINLLALLEFCNFLVASTRNWKQQGGDSAAVGHFTEPVCISGQFPDSVVQWHRLACTEAID